VGLHPALEEAGVPGENHRPWASNWSTLSLAAASRVHPFCNLQSRVQTHPLLNSLSHPGHDIAEILLKVVLNTKDQIKSSFSFGHCVVCPSLNYGF
jgi:hypothetical protein